MQFTITDQKPATLSPLHTQPISGAYDPIAAIRATLVDPLFVPLSGRTVAILDDNGTSQDQDSVLQWFRRTMTDTVDPEAEGGVKSLLSQGLMTYDGQTTLLSNEMFTIQSGAKCKLPCPGPRVLYSAGSDVIPAAKALLANPDETNESGFLASLAFTYSPETLGFWFHTESAYEDFRTWVDQQVTALSSILPTDTLDLMRKFQQLTLKGLTESLILRKDDNDQIQEYSFARTLVHLLMKYSQIQKQAPAATPPATMEAGVLPFVATELFLPRTVVLVNVEAHARTSARKIETEWKMINIALSQPVKVVNLKNLSKLTALPRAMAKAASQAANAKSNQLAKSGRSAKVTFRRQSPSTVDILTGLTRVLRRMKEVNRSQNVFKKVRTSFIKANRRDPSDYNKPGKMVSIHYLPDLHVYVDTSGSISEHNYQQSMLMLIKMAKKLNVDLYFNSFSHVMSQEILLRTKDKSIAQIWKEFQRIPKVAGGTDYEQIWRYINNSPKRRERLSLVISDFEWRARNHRVEHPKNLYYAPCGNMDWNTLVHYAKSFTKSAEHLEPAIAQRLIGMVL